jgi:hypothetical protein
LSRLSDSDRFGLLRGLVPARVANAVVVGAFAEIAGMPWPRVIAAVRQYQQRRGVGHPDASEPSSPPPSHTPCPLVITGQGDFARGWTPEAGWAPVQGA